MLEKFRTHIACQFPVLNGKKLLLAVSGGIDSMVLSDLFLKSDHDFAIAHCNFNLRGNESDGDENFVKSYADKNKIQFFTERFDTEAFAKDNRLSIQLAARQLRYAWFQELIEKHNFDFVLTAHHADDNLETFLINLSRGTGLEGLTGIPAKNGKIIRPMLGFSRDEIQKYASENQIEWREDSSNSSDKYLRNKIRHDIAPQLKSLNPDFLQSFADTLSHLQQSQSLVRDASVLVYKQVAIEKEDKIIFKIPELKRLVNYHAYLYQWLKDFGFSAWEDIYKLVDAQSGKQIFSAGFCLLKDREILILSRLKHSENIGIYTIEKGIGQINIPINLAFSSVGNILQPDDNRIFVDADKLEYPLTLRKWLDGDWFQPFGMTGKKKVSKFFKDEKRSLNEKNDAWILCSGNEILWVVGQRMDDRFKVNGTTKHILQITVS